MSPVLTSSSQSGARTHRGQRARRQPHGSPAFGIAPSSLTLEHARERLAHVLFVEVPDLLHPEPHELTPYPVVRTYQKVKLTLNRASVKRLQAIARGDADTTDLADLAQYVLREVLSWRNKPTAHDFIIDEDRVSHRVSASLSDWDMHTMDTIVQTVRREVNIYRSVVVAA